MKMTATKHEISIEDFAEAMLKADKSFADRVRKFKRRFGEVDSNTLAVLAQSAFFCWGNCEYQNGLIQVCRAIGKEKPTAFFYHNQITCERWSEINTYVVGIQCWLGVERRLPGGVDKDKIAQIADWLGEHCPAKEALAELFLSQLIGRLLNVSFAKMGEERASKDGKYTDFTAWYMRPDGKCYANGNGDSLVIEQKQRIRHEMSFAPGDAGELIDGIMRPSPPPCVHRFSRYMDIQVSSIGALKWRGNLPPNEVPVEKWEAFLDEVKSYLKDWMKGVKPKDTLAVELQKALGKPTDRSKAIVKDFLLAEGRGGDTSWNWLDQKAQDEGMVARLVFNGKRSGKKKN